MRGELFIIGSGSVGCVRRLSHVGCQGQRNFAADRQALLRADEGSGHRCGELMVLAACFYLVDEVVDLALGGDFSRLDEIVGTVEIE